MDQEAAEVVDRHAVEHLGIGVDLPAPIDRDGAGRFAGWTCAAKSALAR